MRRASRVGLVLGSALIVIGLSKVHAAWMAVPEYDYTGSSRFGWSLGLVALLSVVAYGVGLPDLPRTGRAALASALATAVAAART